MLVSQIFPALFAECAAVSASFGDCVVTKSHVNPQCVIITGVNPMEWFIGYCVEAGIDYGSIITLNMRHNGRSDSLSVWSE
jgi:hypothetical protein